jgi:C4-type Zn-finger protein
MANINRKVIIMTKLEYLKLQYLKAKNDRNLHFFDEMRAHERVKGCEEEMERIKKEIRETEIIKETEQIKNKLNECIDFIKHYCDGKACISCILYDEKGNTMCKLQNANPTRWQKIK